MAYTIKDLLDKLIMIEQNACNMYKNLSYISNDSMSKLKTVASILAKEEERHVQYYQKLKKDAGEFSDTELDFDLYDKASSLISEFKKRIVLPDVTDIRSIMEFALEFEKQNAALLIDIRGRVFKNTKDADGTIYMALTDLITEEEKHVRNLEYFLKER